LVIKINDERLIYIWRGKGVLENYENWSSDFVWDSAFREFEGDVTSVSENDYIVQIHYCAGHFDDDFQEMIRYEFPPAYLQYDSTAGLLEYTDMEGSRHFYVREP